LTQTETLNSKINIFWFRRDLRLNDNCGLFHALSSSNPVLSVFIFDTNILDKLEDKKDRRVEFIRNALEEIQKELTKFGSSLLVLHGKPIEVFNRLTEKYDIKAVYTNRDYEPDAIKRDDSVKELLNSKGIEFHTFKDQVIFEKDEIVTDKRKPYTVYTPYMRKWKSMLGENSVKIFHTEKHYGNFYKTNSFILPSLEAIGFEKTGSKFPSKEIRKDIIKKYHNVRDYPALEGTTRLSVHLRFGTVSIRELVKEALRFSEKWLDELIWREFYMMILHSFPHVVNKSFRPEYEKIKWRNVEKEFEAWCEGRTGYPIADAGMRELNETGYMHNRSRMITASFLTKHLLIDWRWGERYFAGKLLDYELASNNGNWQWAAGSGCDAAPYFRIFSPDLQAEKFDPELIYIKKWVKEYGTPGYPKQIVEHNFARNRAIETYRAAVEKKSNKKNKENNYYEKKGRRNKNRKKFHNKRA
jgi:deoxyribodipyrimidine photo-lyase